MEDGRHELHFASNARTFHYSMHIFLILVVNWIVFFGLGGLGHEFFNCVEATTRASKRVPQENNNSVSYSRLSMVSLAHSVEYRSYRRHLHDHFRFEIVGGGHKTIRSCRQRMLRRIKTSPDCQHICSSSVFVHSIALPVEHLVKQCERWSTQTSPDLVRANG